MQILAHAHGISKVVNYGSGCYQPLQSKLDGSVDTSVFRRDPCVQLNVSIGYIPNPTPTYHTEY
jgi:hypothetical protein